MFTEKLSSILIGSTRRTELREWYRTVLAPGGSGEGLVDLGGIALAFAQRDDVTPTNHEPGRMILNFHVQDFDAAQAQLLAAGVEWLVPPDDRPSGRFGTFSDPDGNYLQIISFTSDVVAG